MSVRKLFVLIEVPDCFSLRNVGTGDGAVAIRIADQQLVRDGSGRCSLTDSVGDNRPADGDLPKTEAEKVTFIASPAKVGVPMTAVVTGRDRRGAVKTKLCSRCRCDTHCPERH